MTSSEQLLAENKTVIDKGGRVRSVLVFMIIMLVGLF